jgi:hypothetical protein
MLERLKAFIAEPATLRHLRLSLRREKVLLLQQPSMHFLRSPN